MALLETEQALAHIGPGAIIEVRSALWRIASVQQGAGGQKILSCVGLSGPSRDKHASFVKSFETDLKVCDPRAVTPTPDKSAGYLDTKLLLDACLRTQRPTTATPTVVGSAAIDDLEFQHLPVRRILEGSRPRLLIADDVGLGKTLEAGLVASELILRGRADRILVVTTRAMLAQFQRDFWARFSIPLARLDGAAIRRMRNDLPVHLNVFDQFARAIVSIDTLKRDLQYRQALEASRWDLVIIDEAHNAADRRSEAGQTALRAKLAHLLSQQTEALLLLTATPHDGSASSFASLIRMLDPVRVTTPEALRRKDIEDLVVRRFRSTPEVSRAMRRNLKERRLEGIHFPLGHAEDDLYGAVADLSLEMDDGAGRKRPGHELFRTGVAKALFSSPAACAETLANRLKRVAAGQAKGSARDVDTLTRLQAQLHAIGKDEFAKYGQLLALLKRLGWTGADQRDRLVIFSERLATIEWLAQTLRADLNLPAAAIARIDGASFEDEETAQKAVEDFGQLHAPVRILLASDMASEGLNLHFQCHRLVHFDLPWSLLRFQQRNGRIDRYGQEHTPEIYYFVGESTHQRVRDMWVLEKLVERDSAAQAGIGDPAVFLRASSIEAEEQIVGDAVAAGLGPDAFGALMTRNAETPPSAEWDMLFGSYGGDGGLGGETAGATVGATVSGEDGLQRATLFPDTFSFAAEMLRRLAPPHGGYLQAPPNVDSQQRLIRFALPDDLRARDAYGYARSGDADERYMPVEAVPSDEILMLTDRKQVIDTAIAQARMEQNAWPQVHYLWDVHPIVGWLADRAQAFFERQSAPLARLSTLQGDEIVCIAHGSICDTGGRVLAEVRQAVVVRNGSFERLESVAAFLDRSGLRGDVANREDAADNDNVRRAIILAVDALQTRLVERRRSLEAEIEARVTVLTEALETWRSQQTAELERACPLPSPGAPEIVRLRAERRRAQRSEENQSRIGAQLKALASLRLPAEPNPFVRIEAIFQG